MRMSKLVSEWPANILDWFKFFSFQESILAHSLKMVGGSEVQNSATWLSLIISRKLDCTAKCCMNIKCSDARSLGMHVPI